MSQYRLDGMSDDCDNPLATEYIDIDAADDSEITEAAQQLLHGQRAADPRICYGDLYTPEGYYGQVELPS